MRQGKRQMMGKHPYSLTIIKMKWGAPIDVDGHSYKLLIGLPRSGFRPCCCLCFPFCPSSSGLHTAGVFPLTVSFSRVWVINQVQNTTNLPPSLPQTKLVISVGNRHQHPPSFSLRLKSLQHFIRASPCLQLSHHAHRPWQLSSLRSPSQQAPAPYRSLERYHLSSQHGSILHGRSYRQSISFLV